ncbi:MAG: hypothetical protein K0U38_05820 [Epsilonproteobacteria bacterium]|nr:hypothetical protein [Campylobacterota bacterium]
MALASSRSGLKSNANELSFFETDSSGVNTPIPKIQMAYKEPMALASSCSGLKSPIPNKFCKMSFKLLCLVTITF